jgi:hypothetical protein
MIATVLGFVSAIAFGTYAIECRNSGFKTVVVALLWVGAALAFVVGALGLVGWILC